MIKHRVAMPVAAPIDVAWREYLSPQSRLKWMIGLYRREQMQGQPEEVGSKAQYVYDENGEALFMEEEVLESIEQKLYVTVQRHPDMHVRYKTFFTVIEDKTYLIAEIEIYMTRFWGRLFEPLSLPKIRLRQEADITQYKNWVEKSWAKPASSRSPNQV
jgi:hypothetical protein